jgi:hypothetical protein
MVEKLSQFDVQACITKQLSDIHNKRIVNKATVLKDAANTHAAILYSPLIKSQELGYRAENRFFTADLIDCELKGDLLTLEFPVFSLSLNPDLSPYRWQSRSDQKFIVVSPSSIGRATL